MRSYSNINRGAKSQQTRTKPSVARSTSATARWGDWEVARSMILYLQMRRRECEGDTHGLTGVS